MAAPGLAAPSADLDFLLGQVALALQLTPHMYRTAAAEYAAVGRWLEAPDSPLARFQPAIYPQGSMALETTVRPRGRDEYDLDLVCQMLSTGMTALEVYDAVYRRLEVHPTYAAMLEKKNRCVRLNYPHNFHLDIIPAEPDVRRGRDAIRVPDRERRSWTPSNPKGYVAWFHDKSRVTVADLLERVNPLPRPTPGDEKPPLAIAVQLMKRRRDMLCADDVAPRSIVLTTLAGDVYGGTDCVATVMGEIVAGIQQRIEDALPGRITVANPTNEAEKFCESFASPKRYETFRWFIDQMERDVRDMVTAQGIPELTSILRRLFGDDPATAAVRSYGERLKAARDSGVQTFVAGLGAASGALPIAPRSTHGAHTVQPHRYFGGEDGH